MFEKKTFFPCCERSGEMSKLYTILYYSVFHPGRDVVKFWRTFRHYDCTNSYKIIPTKYLKNKFLKWGFVDFFVRVHFIKYTRI